MHLTCVALLLLAATAPLVAQSPRVGVRRFAPDSFWLRQWERGGAKEPELVVEPRAIVASPAGFVVLDAGTREVIGLDARTGKTTFLLKARGEGPGEFRRPATIVPASGGFALLDHATSRITAFDERGRVAWDTPSPHAFDLEDFCVLADRRIIAKLNGVRDALVLIDTAGRVRARRSVPQPDPGVFMLGARAFVVGPTREGTCALVPYFGPRWFRTGATAPIATHAFVVPHPDARIVGRDRVLERGIGTKTVERITTSESNPGVSSAMLRGDTLIVRGSSAERDGVRLLDYYSLSTGQYLHSRRLPLGVVSLTIAPDGVFAATTIYPDYSGVIAFRPTRTAPPSFDAVRSALRRSSKAGGRRARQSGSAPVSR